MMKKGVVLVMCSTLMLSGCGTNTGTGTYLGAQLGSILGSAIGGLAGGPRGSDLGTVVGMVGGAAVGAAVGNAVDKAEKQEVHDLLQETRLNVHIIKVRAYNNIKWIVKQIFTRSKCNHLHF